MADLQFKKSVSVCMYRVRACVCVCVCVHVSVSVCTDDRTDFKLQSIRMHVCIFIYVCA